MQLTPDQERESAILRDFTVLGNLLAYYLPSHKFDAEHAFSAFQKFIETLTFDDVLDLTYEEFAERALREIYSHAAALSGKKITEEEIAEDVYSFIHDTPGGIFNVRCYY